MFDEFKTEPQKVADALFHDIQNALFLLVHNFDEPETQTQYAERYEIATYEIPRIKRAASRRRETLEGGTDDDYLRSVEERIKRRHISAFVDERFKDCQLDERRYVFDLIYKELEAGNSYEDWDHCLQQLLPLGLGGIRKLRAREQRKDRNKNIRQVTWLIVKGILHLVVVLGIYSLLTGPFEIFAMSTLLLIYSMVALQLSRAAVAFKASELKADSQFIDLRSALGKPLNASVQQNIDRSKADHQRQSVPVLIYQFSLAAIDVVAVWKIISTLVWR